jgi:hypothetical protein
VNLQKYLRSSFLSEWTFSSLRTFKTFVSAKLLQVEISPIKIFRNFKLSCRLNFSKLKFLINLQNESNFSTSSENFRKQTFENIWETFSDEWTFLLRNFSTSSTKLEKYFKLSWVDEWAFDLGLLRKLENSTNFREWTSEVFNQTLLNFFENLKTSRNFVGEQVRF